MERTWERRGGEEKYTSAIELVCHDLGKGLKGTNLPLKGTNLPVTKERLSDMEKTLEWGGGERDNLGLCMVKGSKIERF